ncbi:nicotinate-nucleotide adenylyltransferase [Idiomarina seosinensis]|uniref:Probable nicotinate-nucleotide adenylyltransferase n=1 Tax=Idiomarina seosinensis TaxID=281739 RepID=A0A432ZH41_9GAMM|nr:nicotinate-nucleotide adenylyltransferase [Idiomarina seosinensis]RUO77223.1 nicotinate-nucleotide adenylyltransferase [Idiomarina seosinensis]
MIRALFGGTFDPIHNGHLKAAKALIEELKIGTLHLMPNAVPPHREQPGATGEQRMKMVQLACQPHADLVAEGFELNSDQPSYTVNTLKHFRQQYPADTLLFVMGMDSLVSLDSWHQWQQLLDHSHLLVMPRPGYTLDQASDSLRSYIAQHKTDTAAALRRHQHGLIYIADTPLVNVSATQVRQQLAAGCTEVPVPESVLNYIQQQQLYADTC